MNAFRHKAIQQAGVFFLALSLQAASPVDNPAKAGMDAARLAKIPARMQSFVDSGDLAGVVTLVARHGQVASLEAVGYLDREAKKPIKTDSIFDLRSMTKPVVCLGAVILMEEGLLSLTDPVEKHLPEFRGQRLITSRDGETMTLAKPSRPIVIRDLMTHTSGMPLDPPDGLRELHVQLHKPLAEVVTVLSQQPLEFEPGSKWQYSNTAIATLARIIEVVSGKPLEQFLDQRIFQPLGMKDSFFFPPPAKHDRIAIVYRRHDDGTVTRAAPGTQGGDPYRKGARYSLPEGGLYSTAQDLFALYQMLLNGGTFNGARILSRPAVDLITSVHTGDLATTGPGLGWGLGWTVIRDPSGSLRMQSVGTFGHGGRFGTYCWIDPDKDLIGIFLVQREGGSEEVSAFVQMANAAVTE